MDAVVIDSKDIYVVPVSEDADTDAVLSAYMQVSGESMYSSQGELYITEQTDNLYTIHRKAKKQDNSNLMMFIPGAEIDIASWWAQAYPIIEQTVTVVNLVGGVFYVVKSLREIFQSKGKNEKNGILDVINKDSWNVSELAEKLSISEEEAENMLMVFGFVLDSQKMVYIATEYTKKLRAIVILFVNNPFN